MEKWNFPVGKWNFERIERAFARSASRHTCLSHPPVISRVFRYSRERSGVVTAGEIRAGRTGRDVGERGECGTHTVSYDFRLALAIAAAPTASMNVCMRYELYALCIERVGDKKSRAHGQRDATFRADECSQRERERERGEEGSREKRLSIVIDAIYRLVMSGSMFTRDHSGDN